MHEVGQLVGGLVLGWALYCYENKKLALDITHEGTRYTAPPLWFGIAGGIILGLL